MDVPRASNYIGGRWQSPSSNEYYVRTNPARPGQNLGEYPLSSSGDVGAAVSEAAQAAEGWSSVPGPQRAAILNQFADALEADKDNLARVTTLEQGKTLREALGEVSRAAVEARYTAGEANRIWGQTFPSERSEIDCQTLLEPLGVVAAVSPWNFPVVSPVRKIVPALAFGNTVVLKPASYTPQTAIRLVQLLEKVGLPPGVLNLVMGEGSTVGGALVMDSRVDGVSFTGSTSIGVGIYEQAARRLAKVQLELGGKNAAVVWNYADLDRAAAEIVSAAFLCSGQRCTALSRVIVSEEQADALIERLLARVESIKVGDGLEESSTMGPLVSGSQLETVENYVRLGLENGAHLITGGHTLVDSPDIDGYYYAPTLFDRVDRRSPLAMDEIFGPVLPVLRVSTFEDAIEITNDTQYGLAAALFCDEMPLVGRFTHDASVGMVHVNHGTASQAHVPFGGVKHSGQGAYSIGPTNRDFYTNVKAVYTRWG
jgi:alpha-ketoglutaric semialdehyde dehydrogenase